MQITPPLSPLATRLTAQADEIRPADGARNGLAKVIALMLGALLELMIRLCATRDAPVSAVVPPVVPSAPLEGESRVAPAPRAGGGAMSRTGLAARLLRQAAIPRSDNSLPVKAEVASGGQWAASRPRLDPGWAGIDVPGAAASKNADHDPQETHVQFVAI